MIGMYMSCSGIIHTMPPHIHGHKLMTLLDRKCHRLSTLGDMWLTSSCLAPFLLYMYICGAPI